MRAFCTPFTAEQTKEIRKVWESAPKLETFFNCAGDCLIYENGILIGKEKKDGKYIDYKK